MKRWTIFSASIILASGILFSRDLFAADGRDRAEAEGKVILYTTANTADTKAMTDSFRKIYPKIEVQFDRTSDSQLMERILNEARAGKSLWDVVSTTGFYGYLLKKRGLLAPYDSPERKYFRDGFKDPQAYWTSTYTTYAVFGFNTRLVSKAKSASKAAVTNGLPPPSAAWERKEVCDSCARWQPKSPTCALAERCWPNW